VNQSSPINHEERITTMQRTMKYAAVSIAVSLGITLAGCSKADKAATAESKTSSSTSTSATTSTKSSSTSKTQAPKSARPTIQDYIAQNGITETPIRRGDPGPAIDLPVPDGWETTDKFADTAPYGAIVYTETAVPANPPRILAVLSKLTGNVDPQKVLDLASGELNNIPGFDGPSEGDRTSLSGFEAVQLGGPYDTDGKQGMIAQKTVVIPGQDGLYVLQLNAYSDESEASILTTATDLVDEKTTITS